METYTENVILLESPGAGKGKRRASFEIRRSNIVKHKAVAVRLIPPETYLSMPGTWQQTLDGDAVVVPELKPREVTSNAFDKMQRKLYRVTDEGCLIPHSSWAMRSEGNIDKGYQLMMDAYYGWRPAGGGLGVAEVTNRFGWSEVTQASHLCHSGPMCCNPTHCIAEPRWRNLKRNYCGSTGVCDCVQGIEAPWSNFQCLSAYRRRNIEDLTFLSDPEEIRGVLDNFNCPGFFQNPQINQLFLCRMRTTSLKISTGSSLPMRKSLRLLPLTLKLLGSCK